MKTHARKIATLGKHVAYGGTGGQGAGQRVHDALTNHAAKLGVGKSKREVVEVIRTTVNKIQQDVRAEWVELPKTEPDAWGGIFCGWSKDGPWIWEVTPAGGSQFQDPFATTGSGYAVAHAALINVSHFKFDQQTIEGAKAIA